MMFFSSLTITYSLKSCEQVSSNLDRSAVVFFNLLSCLIKVEREKKKMKEQFGQQYNP